MLRSSALIRCPGCRDSLRRTGRPNGSGVCSRCRPTRWCTICERVVAPKPAGSWCPECLAFARWLHDLRQTLGLVRPHPSLRAGLIAAYTARALAGLPLFDRTNHRVTEDTEIGKTRKRNSLGQTSH